MLKCRKEKKEKDEEEGIRENTTWLNKRSQDPHINVVILNESTIIIKEQLLI